MLRGNPGHRPLNNDEPKPHPAVSVRVPKWLDAKAARIWRELAPQLRALGLLTEIDVWQFGMFCAHLARWQQLYAAGPAATDLLAVGLLRREAEVVQRLAARFGLDPASRTALRVDGTPKQVDPLTAFVRGA